MKIVKGYRQKYSSANTIFDFYGNKIQRIIYTDLVFHDMYVRLHNRWARVQRQLGGRIYLDSHYHIKGGK